MKVFAEIKQGQRNENRARRTQNKTGRLHKRNLKQHLMVSQERFKRRQAGNGPLQSDWRDWAAQLTFVLEWQDRSTG